MRERFTGEPIILTACRPNRRLKTPSANTHAMTAQHFQQFTAPHKHPPAD